jgi:hypothetical protein
MTAINTIRRLKALQLAQPFGPYGRPPRRRWRIIEAGTTGAIKSFHDKEGC